MNANGDCLGYRAVLFDMTDRRLNADKQNIAAIAFESLSGMVITDHNGIIEQVNKAFTQITGYSAQDALGQKMTLLSSGRHDKAFFHLMWTSIIESGSWSGEIWNRRKNGEVFPEWLSISTVFSLLSANF